MVAPEDVVSAFSARLAPLELAANRAWWAASTEVSEQTETERVDADLVLRAALGDRAVYEELGSTRAVASSSAERQIAVVRDRMAPHQISEDLRSAIVRLEARIDATFNRFRPELDGVGVDDNTIATVLRRSEDPAARQRAWAASKTVGREVAGPVRELAHLRNQAARELGFRDYFELALATSELEETRLMATLDAVDSATREPFAAWKSATDTERAARFGGPVTDLRPWHYDDPFFQSAPEVGALDLDAWFSDIDLIDVTRRTYEGIGLDVDPVLARSDLTPRPAKSQHAFCINVDRGEDVRVLCNNVPGSYWAETMLHEFGHAVYDLGLDPALPWSLRTMHPLTTEGIAMLFGRLTLDPTWLTDVLGVAPGAVATFTPELSARHRVTMLVFARWVLVMTNFERGFYADPDGDHDTRWWDLVEQYQCLTRPDDRHAPDWAAKLHVALAPVYYQNYLLGELVASQLQATIRDRFGGIVGRPAVGEYLRREIFAPGWSWRWDELIERATGAPLSVDAFAAELVLPPVSASTPVESA